jgi:hypothetical protein
MGTAAAEENSNSSCKLFRHVYWNDIVPHLPPYSVGDFGHVGLEYRCQGHKSTYTIQPAGATQVPFMVPVAPFAVLDFVLQNIQWARQWLKMPWSIYDHLPAQYLQAFERGTPSIAPPKPQENAVETE